MTTSRIAAHLRSQLVAYLALFVALGGTSYAAVKLQDGQVKNRHLAKNAVTTAKLKNNGVRSSDIKNGTVRASDLVAGVLPDEAWGISFSIGGSTPLPFDMANGNSTGSTIIQAPRDGRLLVRYEGKVTVDCTAGTPTVGLYVNQEPAPLTRVSVPDGVSTPVVLLSTVDGIEAGPVGINARAHCLNGAHVSSVFESPRGITGLLVQP